MDNFRLVGIYLAAGKSSRMGSQKLNLPVANHYLGSMALLAALESRLDVTIAVTRKGDSLRWLTPFSKRKNLRVLACEDADKGQSASLKAGVKAAADLAATGVVVLLADQPFVTIEMINKLVDESRTFQDYAYISYLHRGIPKPPVYFSNCLFPIITELEGDQGARNLIRGADKFSGKRMESEKDVSFFDVDTNEDYQEVLVIWASLMEREGGPWR
ncbi:Purine catabolism protein PucB [Neobacillus rhizosphaerae]|uniref:Purine catabolism protein PucB n=1 Tax=Neobacillus rhizosphaerae TaxID=2880965 RepID=A0ABN8KHT6_9BACI|nr:nucleotidyltransferase family protein [Neobacillus rhizosphaerae]CAH2712998.1 Purine catabolism protein PucB [Neobacillus rhizosphaerae]